MISSKKLSQKPFGFAQFESQLMNTIVALCTKRTPFEDLDGFLQSIDAIRIRISVADQFVLATSLWNVYMQMIEAQSPGIPVDFEVIFPAFSASLKCNSSDLPRNAIFAVLSVIEQIGFPACAISRRLCSMIINATDISEEIRLQSLTRLNLVLSVSSMVHEHFDKYATQLVQLLKDDEQIPMELIDLVVSLMETSVSLLKIPVLIFLQKQVCLSALNKIPNNKVLKLLNALLEHNHEGVPLPIQVAISVFQKGHFSHQNDAEFRSVLARGRAICQMIIRPKRITNCPSLATSTKTVSSDDPTNAANCSSSLAKLQKTQKAEKTMANSTLSNQNATTSNATILMDDNDDEEETDCEEEEECVMEESFEDDASFSEDVITLDDDEEENAAERGNKIRTKVVKGEKSFALKTVDDLLMDFTDE